MTETSGHDADDETLRRALSGDEGALASLYEAERPRLRRMIRLRLDARVAGRVDPEDVLQEAYLDARNRIAEYRERYGGRMPLGLWFRLLAGQRLIDLHRVHLGVGRDAGRETPLDGHGCPLARSDRIAARLLGKLTSPSNAAIRAEQRRIVEEALGHLEPIDREILALRHFEQLSNDECALVLGLKKSAASQRYARALLRLKARLDESPLKPDSNA